MTNRCLRSYLGQPTAALDAGRRGGYGWRLLHGSVSRFLDAIRLPLGVAPSDSGSCTPLAIDTVITKRQRRVGAFELSCYARQRNWSILFQAKQFGSIGRQVDCS